MRATFYLLGLILGCAFGLLCAFIYHNPDNGVGSIIAPVIALVIIGFFAAVGVDKNEQ